MFLVCWQANSSVRLLKNLVPTGKIKVYLAFSGHKQKVIQNCSRGRLGNKGGKNSWLMGRKYIFLFHIFSLLT